MNAYGALEAQYGRIGKLGQAIGFLQWDQAAMMPKGGAAGRAEEMATLHLISHELRVDPRIGEWLDGVSSTGLDSWQRANVREMRRAYRHSTAVPADLVKAASLAGSRCEMVWRDARKADDFATLTPHLEEVVRLARLRATAKGEAFGVAPYDALLDQFEPGTTSADIDVLFGQLEDFLPALIDQVIEHQKANTPFLWPKGPFPVPQQRALGLKLMGTLGFDFQHGRLDVSAHPFCGGSPDDVRITTRYGEDDFTQSLMGVIHETGHALYERGLPAAWRYQPVGTARSMGIHESQSLLMEMQACRSRAFLKYVTPVLQEAFGGEGPAWEQENLYRLYTRVERGLIRVDADEVTYPAHVILRYRLEKALLAAELEVADLPTAWNEGMQALLGVTPSTNRDGCMQDIHWMDGTFGYFPTYTLGAMTAAQLFESATEAVPEILPSIAQGDFSPLVNWLRTKIHAEGRHLETQDLVTQATGRPLDVGIFRRHLERRYLS